jgi:hypothetical protein
MVVFWDVAPCSLVEIDRRFRAIALTIEAVSTSETSAILYQTKRCNILEDNHLHVGLFIIYLIWTEAVNMLESRQWFKPHLTDWVGGL